MTDISYVDRWKNYSGGSIPEHRIVMSIKRSPKFEDLVDITYYSVLEPIPRSSISSASCRSNLANILRRRMKDIGKTATTKLLLCSMTSKTNTFLKSDGSVIRSSSRGRIKSAYSDTWMRASIFMTLISSKEEPGGFGRRQFSPLCRLLLRKVFTGAGNFIPRAVRNHRTTVKETGGRFMARTPPLTESTRSFYMGPQS